MTSRDFAYWLQGLFELANPTSLTVEQTQMIKRHLSLVFHHEIDPSLDGGDTTVKIVRQTLHDGPFAPSPSTGEARPALSPGQSGYPFRIWPEGRANLDHIMVSC